MGQELRLEGRPSATVSLAGIRLACPGQAADHGPRGRLDNAYTSHKNSKTKLAIPFNLKLGGAEKLDEALKACGRRAGAGGGSGFTITYRVLVGYLWTEPMTVPYKTAKYWSCSYKLGLLDGGGLGEEREWLGG